MLNEKFWLAVAFATFATLIIKFVWPKIAKALDSKSKEIAEEILAAKEMRQKAEKLLLKAEKYHAESAQFAEKLVKDAAIEAQKFTQESKDFLEAELAKKTSAAISRIKMEEEHAIRELKSKIVNSALQNIEQDLKNGISENQQEKIASQAVENFSKILN